MDMEGLPFENCFIGVQPKNDKHPLEYWWAVLNGPLANAFLYAHTMKRENLKGLVERIPLPRPSAASVRRVAEYVREYIAEVSKVPSSGDPDSLPLFGPAPASMNSGRARSLLLRIDAEVLRMYDLPADEERDLLETFAGRQRPGLPPGIRFDHYITAENTEIIPLHLYLSPAYARRRLDGAKAAIDPGARARVKALLAVRGKRQLSLGELLELDELLMMGEADAYVTAGGAATAELHRIELAAESADRRLSRLAAEAISAELGDKKRGR